MKLNKIILLLVFLLAVMTIGGVSASENATDNIQIDESSSQIDDLTDSVADEIISDDVLGESKDVEIVFPDEIRAGERFNINITLPAEACGEVYYYFDDDDFDDYSSYVNEGFNTVSSKINEFGEHVLHVRFISDDTAICNNTAVSKTYNINDYGIEITPMESELDYGEKIYFSIIIPAETGKVVVDVNGEIKNFDLSEEGVEFDYDPANASTVTLNVNYKGDGDKFKAKTFTNVLKLTPIANIPNEVIFGTSRNVEVSYADGETIKFILKDGYDENVIDEQTVTVKDSKAIYSIPSDLIFNEVYNLDIVYDNRSIAFNQFRVIPNMNIPGKLYNKQEYNIPVVFPIEYKNKFVEVFIDGNIMFTGKTDDSAKCNIKLSNLQRGVDIDFILTLYDDEHYQYSNYSYYKIISISDKDPSSINLTVDVPDEVVSGSSFYIDGYLADDDEADGDVIVYVDGVEVARDHVNYYFSFSIYTEGLDLKTHTLTLNYTGGDYFKPASAQYQFDVVTYRVIIPENPCYNNGDRITVQLEQGATGNLIIYADGKQVKKFNVEEDWVDFEDSPYYACYFDDLNLKLGAHDIRVYYKGNKNPIDVTKKINLDYTIEIYEDIYIYGAENIVKIKLPEDATGSFNITVDGKSVPYDMDSNSEVNVDISKFYGDHVIAVEYSGDSKYNHPLKVNKTFNVFSMIDNEMYIPYKYDGDAVSLLLPMDAKGNLVIKFDDEIYAKKSFENGMASVSFNDLPMGNYFYYAYYDGDDYEVAGVYREVCIESKISLSQSERIPFNGCVDFYINLPSHVNGTLKVTINGKEKSERLSDGYAKITISNFDQLDYISYSAEFINDDPDQGYDTSIDGDLHIIPVVKLPENMVVFGKNIVSVMVPSEFKGYVRYCVDDGDYIDVKINSNQTDFSLSSITAGEHDLFVSFSDSQGNYIFGENYQVNVLKASAPKLFANSATVYAGFNYNVKVLGVDGKALKGAKVVFKVGKNKAVTRTTNANGIASLPMNYKPAKYTVLVKYAKQTLKPKVTVKRVLALKAVTVKKSAKKVILMATLKKGKLPIKNKVVIFKFNGRNFKAKTNSLGVAKVTVKNAYFKKLAVGKKVIYQASYLKDVVRKVVIIRR